MIFLFGLQGKQIVKEEVFDDQTDVLLQNFL